VALSISRFLLFVNVAHGIQAEPHSPVTNPHVRIGQIIPALSQRLGKGFAGIHLDEKRANRRTEGSHPISAAKSPLRQDRRVDAKGC
jgi:hypothetical protein